MEILIILAALFSFFILNLVMPAGTAAIIAFVPAAVAYFIFTRFKNR